METAINYLISAFLVTLSGLFAGLSVGLLSLSPYELQRKIHFGDQQAKTIYAVRKNGNLLLVTLLLANVAVDAALSIFLGSIAPGIVAGLIATGLITVFGNIVPQSLFLRFTMQLGSRTAWLAQLFIFLLYPICKPMAWVLDKVLGDEMPTTYSKRELVKIIEEHRESEDSEIEADEERIARGALTFGDKVIADVMTPRSMIIGVPHDQIVNRQIVDKLTKHGYSRYPVYEGSLDKIKGMLYAYDLIKSSTLDKKAIDICDKKVYYLKETEKLDHALNAFLKTKHHLFVVVNSFSEITGIIAIEDVIEEILGKEIVDEFDEYDNVREVAEKLQAKPVKRYAHATK